MRKKKVFVTAQQAHYINWFPKDEWQVTDVLMTTDLDLVLFTGGADVNPELYYQQKGAYTSFNKTRDDLETGIYLHCLKYHIPMLGVCRGAQFLTVMLGGKLIQHTTNHAIQGTHLITLFNGELREITSTHHQMCYPFDFSSDVFRLLAWTAQPLSRLYLDGNGEAWKLPKEFSEPEIIHYPTIRALAIQGHPEQMEYTCPTNVTLRLLLKSFLANKLL